MNTQHAVQVDWLTLTTWDMPAFFRAVAYIRRRHIGGWRGKKIMQYTGQGNGNIFYGTAEQRNAAFEVAGHGMIRVSGQAADDFFFHDWVWYAGNEVYGVWKCSRIDLQRTRMPPAGLDMLGTYQTIEEPRNMVLGEKSTIYIGNRSDSPIFVRLYEKLEFLRLEFELKGNRSQWAYNALLRRDAIADVWSSVLDAARLPEWVRDWYDLGNGASIDYHTEEKKSKMESRLRWLQSLDHTIYEMCHDHDIGERTRELLETWAEYGQNIDS